MILLLRGDVRVDPKLGLRFSLPYASYQLDVSFEGQGMLKDTYRIVIAFRPDAKHTVPSDVEIL